MDAMDHRAHIVWLWYRHNLRETSFLSLLASFNLQESGNYPLSILNDKAYLKCTVRGTLLTPFCWSWKICDCVFRSSNSLFVINA
jgi:hypothetical protein